MKRQRLAGIEKEMSRVISRLLYEEVKNPKIKGLVSISHLRVTEDLKFADVAFSVIPLSGEKINEAKVLEGLQSIKGFLRKRLGQEIKLRYIPELRITLDDTISHAVKISKLIDEVK